MRGSVSGIWLLAGVISLTLIAAGQSAEYRLSRNVLPSLYKLTINIQGDAANPGTTFDGEVAITLQATQPNVLQITLHKDSLDISSCMLYNKAGLLQQNIATTSLKYDQETQQLTVPLAQALAVNEIYTLNFVFTGKVRTDMAGLFSANYLDKETGKTKWVLLTQMQRLNARLVFPCFDEPAFKAKFELHIGRPNGFNAISNTKMIKSTNEGNNRFMDQFDVTPIMSTYLLAFVISEYQARGNVSDYAVVSRPEYFSKTEFSYKVGERALAAYDGEFQQPYKQLGNQVLLFASSPRFPHNGMENWGLIIYSDEVLVQDPGYTDGWKNKEFTIRIITHETSHMWFGDSVTFSWWSYFWLNEAFARYYEYFMAHQLYPEYQLDQQFVVRQLQMILQTDSGNSTQPMTSPETSIQTPSEIGHKFSSIAYAKGASIVRMWRNIMGADNFNKAIRSYLKQHHLGNTVPSDLFAHLKANWPAAPAVDLDDFLSDFTEQPGYPVVTVNQTLENRRFVLTQKRFLINRRDGSNTTLRYTIPITFATNLKPTFQNLTPGIYFRKINSQINLTSPDPLDWIILNIKQSNYYRVLYDTPILRKIQEALSKDDHSSIPVENRAQLVDDLFNFAHAQMLDYTDVFQFVEYMVKDVEYIPWYAAYSGMQHVAKRLTPQQLTNFEKYLRDITAAVYAKLGVNPNSKDTVLDVYNRNMQVSWLCKFQNADCNNQVKDSFEGNSEKPSPDYRETFYCAAARTTGYARVLDLYKKETNSNERDLLWRAASCTRDYRTHYQNEILSSSTTVSQKTNGLAQLYQQNPDLITPIYALITEDINKLNTALGSWSKTAEVLSELSDYFTTREQEKQFSEFVNKNSALFGSSAAQLKTAQTKVNTNLQWAEKRLGTLVNFLASRNGAAGSTVATLLIIMSTLLGYMLKYVGF
ncbi:membrane alanyl aminopeptidase [Drosophila innubila]|uniref:membrane alanyl aminopeptidase n=1 Tax=Drosophila innubila TaxID=198719 RepID=UPI00148CCD30|nr:membrane alanyl aminopeptidase [Drosophila innubila]